ncbi:hypothetical protein HH308_12735 [Gordonia sp. TBRC 11910]|uniref:Alkaline shock response membrane anchor protein AmaP n=1 Tax=Gordonia asplenii TaxID=2725283 RepID=A0A848L351_9ACTN|nr:hypothetical protein [Gordonia asplenii]NMO02078.1 hypothetical protein [Gordonia asplenii]
MNHLPATVHRLVVLVLGVCAVVVGVGALAWRLTIDPVDDWIERIDTGAAVRFADGTWWTAVLVGIAVLAVVVAAVLLVTVIRPMKAQRVLLPASTPNGELTVAPGLLATAAANDLARDPMVLAASGRAINDRGHQIIRLTVQAHSTRSYADLAKVCSRATDALADALAGAPVEIQVLLQLKHPDPGQRLNTPAPAAETDDVAAIAADRN